MDADGEEADPLWLNDLVATPLPGLLQQLVDGQMRTGSRPFDSWHIVATQHLQGSFAQLFKALVLLGAAPTKTYVLGKTYSARSEVVEWLRNQGVLVAVPEDVDLCASYERTVEREVIRALAQLQSSRPSRLLIIDEGGRFVRRVARSSRSHLFTSVAGVEQTTRGLALSSHEHLAFPVVDVASCHQKRNLESQQIAVSMVSGLRTALERLGESLKRSRVVIAGAGAVGLQLATAIEPLSAEVTIVEPNETRRSQAASDGLQTARELTPSLMRGRITISSTGRCSLKREQADELIGGEILVNGGSSDIEFPAALWRCMSQGGGVLAEHSTGSAWRWDYRRLSSSGGESWLLNGGFPINFTGQRDTVSPDSFQLTRALMLAGCIQAVSGSHRCGHEQLSTAIANGLQESWLDLERGR